MDIQQLQQAKPAFPKNRSKANLKKRKRQIFNIPLIPQSKAAIFMPHPSGVAKARRAAKARRKR